EDIPVAYDGDGLGVNLITHAGGYNFIPVCASGVPLEPRTYHRRRDELWFVTAKRARAGRLCLARLPRDIRQILRQQAMAPLWRSEPEQGRCEVEPKAKTKERLKRGSPDDMDALNLAYAVVHSFPIPSYSEDEPPRPRPFEPGAFGMPPAANDYP